MAVEYPTTREAPAWERAARRAYELGRLRTAFGRALGLSAVLGAVAFVLVGRVGWLWMGVPLALWTLAGWRGGALLRGGHVGLLAGLATLVMPLTLLRPCCRPGMVMTASCCTRPGNCVAVGAALGLSLAAFLVSRERPRRAETAAGMALGVVCVSVLKCPVLFAGEALGLLGGLLGGVAAAALVGAWWSARTAPGR